MNYSHVEPRYETKDEEVIKSTQQYMANRTLHARLDKVLRCFLHGMSAPALSSQTPTVYELYNDQAVVAVGKVTPAGYVTDGSVTTACLVELGMNSHVLLHDLLTMTMKDGDGKPIALIMRQGAGLYAPFFAVMDMATNALDKYKNMEETYRMYKTTKRKHKRNRAVRNSTKH